MATIGLAGAAANEDFAPWDGIDRRAPLGVVAGVPAVDLDAIRAAAFAEGLAEGRRTVEAELAAERAALATLAENLECCRPEAPQALADVFAEVIGRLVHQVVGEIEIADGLIRERVDGISRLIADQAGPARMRLHPDDIARLDADYPFPLIADPTLIPGSVIVETASGWIEDGSDLAMERLRQALDGMALPR